MLCTMIPTGVHDYDINDSAKTRIQAIPTARRTKDDLSMLSVLLRIYRKEGVAGLYRGFGATMLNTFSMRK